MNQLVCIAVLLFAVALKAPAAELPLLPYPQQLQLLPGELRLGSEWQLKIDGKTAPELHASLQRLQTRIARQTAVALALKPGAVAQLHIRVRSGKAMANNLLEVDESYRLHIHGQGIAINAQETLGAMRALETLAQLIQVRDGHFYLPQVMIEDAPRFAWRGLLLDTSRHFFSVASIKRQLDMMAAAKYNLFHWHLTDDQGWRIESKRFPKLQQLASDGDYYTQAQIKEVVAYARERGIQVLPEIDMPGHASAIAVAYPELMSAPGPYAMEYRWGVHQPTLNPANEAVYQFIEQLLGEVAALFPFDYVHIGGDEVDPQQWQRNSRIQQFMRAQGLQDHLALQAYFNRRVQNILRKHQRKMIGWDEIQHGDLPRDIIIHSWQGPDGVSRAVRAGFKAILSTGYYLDQPQTAAYHYRQDPLPPAPVQVAAPAAGELWHSWSFSLPRKRGKPIEGSFTLIGTGKSARGFIDFAGKSRRALAIQQLSEQQAVFGLDTWMGPVQFEVQFNQEQFNQEKFNQVQGQAWVGNAAYPLTGQQIAGIGHPQQQLPPPQWRDFALSAQQQALVLGGEAALWSEIVDEQSLDLRLWPRALAVAERLWSAADCCAENDFYRRVETTMSNARSGLGLQDQQQQQQALKRLAGNQSHVLAIFSEALEPAHYYHRQHEKSARETYSKADPLNRLVDALPAENLLHRELQAHWQRWLAQGDKAALTTLKNRFKHWQNNHDDLMALLRQGKDVQGLQGLEKLAENLHWVSGLGLQWLAACQGKPWSEAQRQGALQQLAQARGMQQEMLLSTATLVQHMLQSGAGCVR